MKMSPEPESPRTGSWPVHSDVLELMHRYFGALDGRDFDLLTSCFSAESTLSFAPMIPDPVTDGIGVISGRNAIREIAHGVTRFAATTHLLANLTLVDSAGSCVARTRCVVYASCRDTEEDIVVVRGLLYTDRLVRDAGAGWVIAERVHSLQWVTGNGDI
jgi:hypothetical protein